MSAGLQEHQKMMEYIQEYKARSTEKVRATQLVDSDSISIINRHLLH